MRVSVVCSDPFFQAGIQSLLEGIADVVVEKTDGSLASTSQSIKLGRTNAVVISGDNLPAEQFAELSRLRSKYGLRIVAVSNCQGETSQSDLNFADALVFRNNGAQGLQRAIGLLMMQTQDLRSRKHHSSPKLTRREEEVANLIAKGKSNRQIADELGIREQSVKNLVSVIMRKLDCENRVQIALIFSSVPTKIAG